MLRDFRFQVAGRKSSGVGCRSRFAARKGIVWSRFASASYRTRRGIGTMSSGLRCQRFSEVALVSDLRGLASVFGLESDSHHVNHLPQDADL